MFAIGEGKGLSTHSAPGTAMALILESQAEITIDGKVFRAKSGEGIVMPAGILHAVKAITKFKIFLTAVKNGGLIMESKWKESKTSFPVIDVRHLVSNFLPMILKRAQKVELYNGICVVQSFEPKPLYSALKDLGFNDYMTDKISDNEYRVYAYRTEIKETSFESGADMPFKPTAILNFKVIDDNLAGIVVDFWETIWDKKDSAIDLKTKLMLSMSNAIGAARYRQATRELIKAYSLGLSVKELDELFSLFAWNQGIGHFSSEIGPSTVFGVYKHIKKREEEGWEHREILDEVMGKFGDKNPNVSTLFKKE